MTRALTRTIQAVPIFAIAVGLTLVTTKLATGLSAPGAEDRPPRESERVSVEPKGPKSILLGFSRDQPQAAAKPETPKSAGPATGRVPRSVASLIGSPVPGSTMILDGSGSEGEDLRFRWVQTGGPTVLLDEPTRSQARFEVPDSAGPLTFLLIVANSAGVDSGEMKVTPERPSEAREATVLRADAGDDQIGLIGRQITLNGLRSEPRGGVGFRWIQIGGPSISLKIEDRYIFSFVPNVPGIYRFALVVAAGGSISEPDEVTVTVGAGTRTRVASDPAPGPSIPASESLPTQELSRSTLAAVPGGPESAEGLGRAFADTADRMDLYYSFADAFSEMSRRLEPILPADPTLRKSWEDRVFHPLTSRLVESSRSEGLDLRTAEGQSSPLTAGQRAALAEQLRLMAEGFRSIPGPR